MKKLLCCIIILGLLTIGGTALGFSFKYPTSSFYAPTGFSQSTSFTYAPTGFGFGGSFASGCGDCYTLDTWSTSSTYTRDGWNGSISTASAGAYVSTIICEEPPVCGDVDDDGVCDESDNCEFVYNPNQADRDDDQIGDECDECPGDSNDVCNNEPPPCDDRDEDRICDADDPCPDDPENTCNDPEPTCQPDDTACLLDEACPCENDWRNHGAYVTCTVQFRNDHKFDQPSLPDLEHIVSDAGCSDCGGSHQGRGCD